MSTERTAARERTLAERTTEAKELLKQHLAAYRAWHRSEGGYAETERLQASDDHLANLIAAALSAPVPPQEAEEEDDTFDEICSDIWCAIVEGIEQGRRLPGRGANGIGDDVMRKIQRHLDKLAALAPEVQDLSAGLLRVAATLEPYATPDDLDVLRDSAAALRSPAQAAEGEATRKVGARDPHPYPKCCRCGKDTGMDAVVSHDVWVRISPTGNEGGILCLWCMDDLCAERGIPANTPVRLYYPGKVLVSALYPDDMEPAPTQDGDAETWLWRLVDLIEHWDLDALQPEVTEVIANARRSLSGGAVTEENTNA